MRIVVTVDRTLCMGNQLCVGEAGDMFELDDEGRARVSRSVFTEVDVGTLESAAALCPTGAISVKVNHEEDARG